MILGTAPATRNRVLPSHRVILCAFGSQHAKIDLRRLQRREQS